MNAILGVRGLNVTFRSRGHFVEALRSVDMEIREGERVGLVGGSGSGKSTLARTLVGLQQPTSGTVLHRGTPVPARDRQAWNQVRRTVSMVFQDPNSSLNPRMRLRDIVTEPLGRRDADAAVRAMESVALDADLLTRYPHELSGGQRQRVAIARALVDEPEVLIADEPVSALDVSVRAQVIDLLRTNVERRGLALLFVSHDLAVVRHLCDHVLVMERGSIVETGPAVRVLDDPQHPYTKALVDASLSL